MRITTRTLFVCTIFAAILPRPISAQAQPDPGAKIAPFLSPETAAVAHIDLTRLDLDAFARQIEDAIQRSAKGDQAAQILAQLKPAVQPLGQWAESLTHAGARDFYWILDLSGTPDTAGVRIVPIENGASADAIGKALLAVSPVGAEGGKSTDAVETIRNAVCVGSADALAHIKNAAAPRPDFASSIQTTNDAPVWIVFVPTADTRKVLSQMLPQLPPELGGASTAPLLAARWAAASLNIAPKLSASVRFQADNADSAKALLDALSAVQTGVASRVPPEFQPAIKTLNVEQAGDAVAIAAGTEFMNKAAISFVAASVKSRRVESMRHMKQLIILCYKYADENKGSWPDDLKAAAAHYGASDQVFVNPMEPERKDPYVYLKPAATKIESPSSHIVLYQAHEQNVRQVAVGFADGHIEVLKKTQFDEQLKAQQAAKSQ